MTRPMLLSEDIPLSSASEIGNYASDGIVPLIYGTTTVSPIRMSADSSLWLLADHPIARIEQVTIDELPVFGWELIHRTDNGKTRAWMRLTRSPGSLALAVTVTGMLNTSTGETLRHPADICADILRRCGWTVPSGAFLGLRSRSMSIGGAIQQSSIRAAISGIIESIGAVWNPRTMAARYRDQPPATSGRLTQYETEEYGAVATYDIASAVHLRYRHEPASGELKRAITVAADAAIARHGRIVKQIDAPWLREDADAASVARILLQDSARASWRITAAIDDHDYPWEPGDTLTIDHPHLPTGDATITAMDTTPDDRRIDVELTMHVGNPPQTRIEQRTTADYGSST